MEYSRTSVLFAIVLLFSWSTISSAQTCGDVVDFLGNVNLSEVTAKPSCQHVSECQKEIFSGTCNASCLSLDTKSESNGVPTEKSCQSGYNDFCRDGRVNILCRASLKEIDLKYKKALLVLLERENVWEKAKYDLAKSLKNGVDAEILVKDYQTCKHFHSETLLKFKASSPDNFDLEWCENFHKNVSSFSSDGARGDCYLATLDTRNVLRSGRLTGSEFVNIDDFCNSKPAARNLNSCGLPIGAPASPTLAGQRCIVKLAEADHFYLKILEAQDVVDHLKKQLTSELAAINSINPDDIIYARSQIVDSRDSSSCILTKNFNARADQIHYFKQILADRFLANNMQKFVNSSCGGVLPSSSHIDQSTR